MVVLQQEEWLDINSQLKRNTMKQGYTIDQYGTNNPKMILCYNWHEANNVWMVNYYSHLPKCEIKFRKYLVAIFKIKPKYILNQ